MPAASNTVLIRWKIVDFYKQRADAEYNHMTSGFFVLPDCPTAQFALFVQWGSGLTVKDAIRVVLKQADKKPVEASVKIWIEHGTTRQRFGEASVGKHVFENVGDQFGFNGVPLNNRNFWDSYGNHETFFVCCEMTCLNPKPVMVENYVGEFHHDFWTLYEEDIYDAIVKVGNKEFKVLKTVFMAHSNVFKSMFLSKFKEGVTSEVWVNDVDENTMTHLVKWMYTGHVEDGAPTEKLFSASDKYDIKVLKKECIQHMINSFNGSNVFTSLVISVKHCDTHLKEASLKYIDKFSSRADFMRFFTSPEWKELEIKYIKVAHEIMELLKEK